MQRVRRKNRTLLLVGLAAAVMVVGCAQRKAYERGTKLSEQGQYQQAVAELERAIALAEENHNSSSAKRYREKLAETKRLAGQFYYRNAQLAFDRADLVAAESDIAESVRYDPMMPQYLSLRDRIERAVANAEGMRVQALSLAKQKEWDNAIDRMNEALRAHRTLPNGQADLRQIKERAYDDYVMQAQEKLIDGNLAAVERDAQRALTYREDGREAKDLLQTVSDRREAASLVAQGQRALELKNYEEALRVLDQARQLHPTRAGLSDLLAQARYGACDQWLSQGREALAAGDNVTALRRFNRSAELLPDYGDVVSLKNEASLRLATEHTEAAQRYFGEGYGGAAALHATVALGYQPTLFEARLQLGQAVGLVEERVRYAIDFVGFEANAQQRIVANRLAAATLQHLMRAKPANVVIVERAGDGADAGGDDATLVGQILQSRVTSSTERTAMGESVYQDGMRPEPNPEYVAAAAEVSAALDELEHARAVLAEAQARLARYERADPADADALARRRVAQADVNEAQQRLVNAATRVGAAQLRASTLPREVLVPNMVTHTYPIETVTWTAQVSCMVKLTDSATGELLLAERIDGQDSASDSFVPADLARNVQEDPLELPSSDALLERAADSMMARLRQVLDTACRKHGDRFVTQFQRAQTAGDVAGAVDGSVLYLFAYPKGAAQTETMLTYLHSYLGEQNDLLDLDNLLRMHCHILER